jgi:hypothetical protein
MGPYPQIDRERELIDTTRKAMLFHFADSKAARALKTLQDSMVLRPDFPRYARLTYTGFVALSEAERTRVKMCPITAIQMVGDILASLQANIWTIAQAKHQPAIPTLIALWTDCAVLPVRDAAGHALYSMNTPEAYQALENLLDDHEQFSRFMAIKSIFAKQGPMAYEKLVDRFAHREPSDPVPEEVLRFLSPSSFSKDGPIWHDGAQEALRRDNRWLMLCARHRNHSDLGATARDVLRYAPPKDRDEVLALERVREAQCLHPSPPVLTTRNGKLLARYMAGEYDAVWREIREAPRIDGAYREEVMSIAYATMDRVAQNANIITHWLRELGWQVLGQDYADTRTLPTATDEKIIQEFETISGHPLPPSLLAFWRCVGGINWVWNYRSTHNLPNVRVALPMDEMDPLCVYAPSALQYLLEEWKDQIDQPDPDLVDPFFIDLSPDYLHKANISGGGPYGVSVPFHGADPILTNEKHKLPFVDYLRLAFKWGGFPGLEAHGERKDVQAFLRRFDNDLIPF